VDGGDLELREGAGELGEIRLAGELLGDGAAAAGGVEEDAVAVVVERQGVPWVPTISSRSRR
jgi:hypothetical protein